MNKNNLYYKKYIKYKSKYLNLSKKNIQNQYAGDLNELNQYLKEASDIFKIVDFYGKKDDIEFFITGSVAVLYYYMDFHKKYYNILSEEEKYFMNSMSDKLIPNDLDFNWLIEDTAGIPIFADISDIIQSRTDKPVVITVGEKFTPESLLTTNPIPLFVPKPLSIRVPEISNVEGLTCEDKTDLLVIGSHYSRIPVPANSIFYKCQDKISKFDKIDFLGINGSLKYTYMMYNKIRVRLPSIRDLFTKYNSHKRERDKDKIYFIKFYYGTIRHIKEKEKEEKEEKEKEKEKIELSEPIVE